jgi:hypothetical protein
VHAAYIIYLQSHAAFALHLILCTRTYPKIKAENESLEFRTYYYYLVPVFKDSEGPKPEMGGYSMQYTIINVTNRAFQAMMRAILDTLRSTYSYDDS